MKLAFMLLTFFSLSGFASTKDLDLELIKLACKDPGAVHNQMPPSDLKVTCRQSMCDWVPGPTTMSELPNWKKVCGSLMTNKPGIHVPKFCWGLDAAPTSYGCPSYEEQVRETEMEFGVTCDEVMGMASIRDFCAGRMAMEIEANEQILTVTKTGKKMSICGDAIVSPAQK
jgi:hypothetical protein